MSIFTSLKKAGQTGVKSSSGKTFISPKLASTIKSVDWGSVANTTLDVYNKVKSTKDGKPQYPAGTSIDDLLPGVMAPKNQTTGEPWYKAPWVTIAGAILTVVAIGVAVVKFFTKKKSKRF